MYKLELENGKYTIIEDLNKGRFEALRYGDEWRNLGAEGDNLILALVYKVQELEEIIVKQAEELDNIDIANMIKEREANDTGIRYTLDEVKKMREDKLKEETEDYKFNIITLTDEQMGIVINKLQTTEWGWHGNGCDCGTFEVELSGVGYLAIDRHCHKSNSTDVNKAWKIDKTMSIYNKSIIDSEFNEPYNIEELEENGIVDIGELNKDQTRVLLEYARENTIKDLGYDENWNK